MRKKPTPKPKKCSKFCRRASLHVGILSTILHAKAKPWIFFQQLLRAFSSAAALPIVPKVECNFKVIRTSLLLSSKTREAVLNSWSIFKTYLKVESVQIVMFSKMSKEEKIFTTKVWGLYSFIFHSEATKTLNCIFPFHVKFYVTF